MRVDHLRAGRHRDIRAGRDDPAVADDDGAVGDRLRAVAERDRAAGDGDGLRAAARRRQAAMRGEEQRARSFRVSFARLAELEVADRAAACGSLHVVHQRAVDPDLLGRV